jgi:hypothetical protein
MNRAGPPVPLAIPSTADERRAILEQAAELLIPLGNCREVAGAYSTAAYVALTEDRVAEATSLLDTARKRQRTSKTHG